MRIPPALTLLCLFVIGALDGTFPGLKLQFPGQFVIASLLGLAGLVLVLIAIRGFYQVKTTVLPQEMDRSSSLVTGGGIKSVATQCILGWRRLLQALEWRSAHGPHCRFWRCLSGSSRPFKSYPKNGL